MSSDERHEVLSTLAHELRTPLAVIAGFAELLQARDDERTREEAALRISEATGQLRSVVDDLLAGVAADKGDLGQRLIAGIESARRARGDTSST